MVVAKVGEMVAWERVLIYAAVTFALGFVNWPKGKFWRGVASLFGILWRCTAGAAIRLAKPDSWWARKLYDEKTMVHARERFPDG
jgi:hypothetical protein